MTGSTNDDAPLLKAGKNTTSADFLVALGGVQRFPRKEIELCICRDFVKADERAALIERIDAKRRPSTIADPNGDEAFRTSETCDLDHDDAIVKRIDDRICNFLDIDPRYGEPLQGQRYAVGQEFKAHTDFFDLDGADYQKFCSVAGQRTWTAMVYLNEPAAGGATRFTHFGKSFAPKAGTLLTWNNRNGDGSTNNWTLHHGMKVRKGTKYIVTKWFRERPWGWE